jgi:hypothetical protein
MGHTSPSNYPQYLQSAQVVVGRGNPAEIPLICSQGPLNLHKLP